MPKTIKSAGNKRNADETEDAEVDQDEETSDTEATPEAPAPPAKAMKTEVKVPSSGRGRGRPPLTDEEKAERAARKIATATRGRGRPRKKSTTWLSHRFINIHQEARRPGYMYMKPEPGASHIQLQLQPHDLEVADAEAESDFLTRFHEDGQDESETQSRVTMSPADVFTEFSARFRNTEPDSTESTSNPMSHIPQTVKGLNDEEPITPAENAYLYRPMVNMDDQHDVYGKNIAHKLRNLPREQRIHTEKLFSDILYEAELGNLTRKSVFLVDSDCRRIIIGTSADVESLEQHSCTNQM